MTTTSINFHLRPSLREGRHTGKLFIRVIHNRLTKRILRDYAVFTDEWDAETKRIILPTDGLDTGRYHRLSLIAESMKNDLKRLQEIVSLLEQDGEFTASDIVKRFTDSLSGNTVSGYAGIAAGRLLETGHERTARAYRSAARSLSCFNGGRDTALSEITPTLIRAYERHLIGKGLKLNTVSFYLRNLRALYFRAVGEKLISRQPENPFAGLHTGVYETRRRALDNDQLRALAALEISLLEQLEALESAEAEESGYLSQDRTTAAMERRKTSALYDSLMYFLFCYHARGMSFVDMAHLRKQDIGKNTLSYRRRKTGRPLEVKVTKPMRRILAHFRSQTAGSQYAFPVIGGKGDMWRQYETGLKKQNRLLKELAAMAGIADGLSTHAARHTWATTAKRLKYPVDVICEALGHRDAKTTGIYLASFDRAMMDELSVKVSAAVKAA